MTSMTTKQKISMGYNLISMVVGILLYEYYDLFVSTIAGIAILGTKVLFAEATRDSKLTRDWIERLDWFALILMLVCALPGVLLENEFLIKLQGPISSLMLGIAAVGFRFFNLSISKELFGPVLEALLGKKLPDDAWKKIDYLFLLDCFIGATAGAAMAIWLPTDTWAYAKYSLVAVSMIISHAQTYIAYSYAEPAESQEGKLLPENEDEAALSNNSTGNIAMQSANPSTKPSQQSTYLPSFTTAPGSTDTSNHSASGSLPCSPFAKMFAGAH